MACFHRSAAHSHGYCFFQLFVFRQPLPQFTEVIVGFFLVVVGLSLFIEGLKMGLFPIGETMAHGLAQKGSLFWLLSFAFLLGFSTTITAPLVAALGVGLASIIRGRKPLTDGFGLIAFASPVPMIFVMIYGLILFP